MTTLEARELCEVALDQLVATVDNPSMRKAAEQVRAFYRIEFNGRFTRRLGDASARLMRIRLSAPLWPRISEDQRLNTVTHELAHLVAEVMRPGTGHGLQWKYIHRAMGGDGRRTAGAGVVDQTGLGEPWHCACRTHWVSRRKNTNMQRALNRGALYKCRGCRIGLVPGEKGAES